MHLSDQLALPFERIGDAELGNYIESPDGSTAQILEAFLAQGRESFAYVAGPPGSGKTHLAIGAMRYLERKGIAASYLSMHSLTGMDEQALLEAEQVYEFSKVVIVDDLQLETVNPLLERFLFRLFNHVTASGQLLVFSRVAVSQLGLDLPDLASRLGSGISLRLKNLDDEGKQRVLRGVAAQRGLILSTEVTEYILRRSSRDLRELLAVLDVLDQASWVKKQKLSIPFIKKVMDW